MATLAVVAATLVLPYTPAQRDPGIRSHALVVSRRARGDPGALHRRGGAGEEGLLSEGTRLTRGPPTSATRTPRAEQLRRSTGSRGRPRRAGSRHACRSRLEPSPWPRGASGRSVWPTLEPTSLLPPPASCPGGAAVPVQACDPPSRRSPRLSQGAIDAVGPARRRASSSSRFASRIGHVAIAFDPASGSPRSPPVVRRRRSTLLLQLGSGSSRLRPVPARRRSSAFNRVLSHAARPRSFPRAPR